MVWTAHGSEIELYLQSSVDQKQGRSLPSAGGEQRAMSLEISEDQIMNIGISKRSPELVETASKMPSAP